MRQGGQDHRHDLHPRSPQTQGARHHGVQVRQHPHGGIGTGKNISKEKSFKEFEKPRDVLGNVHVGCLLVVNEDK